MTKPDIHTTSALKIKMMYKYSTSPKISQWQITVVDCHSSYMWLTSVTETVRFNQPLYMVKWIISNITSSDNAVSRFRSYQNFNSRLI